MAGINLLSQLRGKKKNKEREASSVSSVSQVSIKQSTAQYFMGESGDGRRLFLRFFIMFVIFFLGYKGLEVYLATQLEAPQAELEKVQQNTAKENKKKSELKNVQDEMQGYLTRMQDIQSKIKVVSDRERMRDYFVRVFDYLVTEMPREVWFTEITAVRGSPADKVSLDKDNSINLKGYANSPQAVSELILKLDSSVYFPKSELEHLEEAAPSETNHAAGTIPVPINARKFSVLSKLGE